MFLVPQNISWAVLLLMPTRRCETAWLSWDTLQKNGAVSSATVLEMAQGARRAFNTDVGLSVSCIAGPGGATTDKPVGTSWCGLSTPDGDWSYHFQLEGNREEIKSQLAHLALAKLGDYLQK